MTYEIIEKDYTKVTKDSGHYRPTDAELEIARVRLATMFGDGKQNRKEHGIFTEYKRVRHNPQ